MAGQQFQYDENGGTFYYFLLSFLVLVLIPTTFYLWPRRKKEDPAKLKEDCQCEGCSQKKIIIAFSEPYKTLKTFLIRFCILMGWVFLIFLAYRVSQFDYETVNFDPFEILGIPADSSQADIKKAYRKLSLIWHPDKETGDEKTFMKIIRAYKALTDEEAKKNWEQYGNIDGPGAMSFGIALPSWIVEKENSIWVLGLYALVFMIALPIAVGSWWYQSIRYSGDKVLLDTAQMYFFFFHKTPHMLLKRVIMILAASLEFDKRHNSHVIERQSDNDEVPTLIRQLPNLNEKCKEPPLCRMYSIKARAIIHAHLSRLTLNSETLEKDRQLIVRKCPYLIQEMVSCVHQLVMLAYARRVPRVPNIETIENCMKLSPMIIQGLWETKSPLLQLPHITEDHVHNILKKKHIKNLQQFAQLKYEESKYLLKDLSDSKYNDVMKVLGKMPLIDFSIRCEVIDDENTNIVTAGAIVTITVTLVRRNMKDLFGDSSIAEKQRIKDDENVQENEEVEDSQQQQSVVKKSNQWSKFGKRSHKGKGKKSGGQAKTKQAKVFQGSVSVSNHNDLKIKNSSGGGGGGGGDTQSEQSKHESDSDSVDDSGAERESGSVSEDDERKNSSIDNNDDDDEWERLQSKLNKREKLEGKSRLSHSVHCPYFPEDKQEYWWTYICDRKSRTLLTAPYHVTNLVDKEEIQLKLTAPRWPGLFTFTVCLRSDSYLGMDQQQDLKLDVQKAPAPPTDHPQWDISDTESEQHDEQDNESEYTTDSSDDEA